jgi:hypothetical protein
MSETVEEIEWPAANGVNAQYLQIWSCFVDPPQDEEPAPSRSWQHLVVLLSTFYENEKFWQQFDSTIDFSIR